MRVATMKVVETKKEKSSSSRGDVGTETRRYSRPVPVTSTVQSVPPVESVTPSVTGTGVRDSLGGCASVKLHITKMIEERNGFV